MAQTTRHAVSEATSLADALARAEAAYRNHSYAEAFDKYRRLGEEGHVDSQVMVAWMLLNGLGVARDEEAASTWYARAAAFGSPQGNFYYARYLTKVGRYREARVHYMTSAQAGYLPSVFWVGYSSARGQGTDVDNDEAYRYLLRAARRGHMHAVRELGVMDMQGRRGIIWRLIGVAEFTLAVLGAFLLALVARESDLLRA